MAPSPKPGTARKTAYTEEEEEVPKKQMALPASSRFDLPTEEKSVWSMDLDCTGTSLGPKATDRLHWLAELAIWFVAVSSFMSMLVSHLYLWTVPHTYLFVEALTFFLSVFLVVFNASPFRRVISTCYYNLTERAAKLLKRVTDLARIGKVLVKDLSERAADTLVKKATDLAREGKGLVEAWQNRTLDFVAQKHKMRWQHPHRIVLPLHGTASYVTAVLAFVKHQIVGGPSLLGIRGMRGVGKTTLLRFVRDSYAHDFSPYNNVFFVGAGPGCTVARLQYVLGVNIGLGPPPHQISNTGTAAKIISSSLKGRPFLLLLDDVRERLDLAAVGLPMPLGRRQKVIFTTRNQAICGEMGCASNTIQMECLGAEDAWSLFEDKVGDEIIDAHPHIEHLAKKMAAECRGLPSALCALSRAMSTKRDVKEWRYAYDMLLKRKRTPVNEIQEMDDEGYSDLHLLEDELQGSAFF